jgi:hypothetical protein
MPDQRLDTIKEGIRRLDPDLDQDTSNFQTVKLVESGCSRCYKIDHNLLVFLPTVEGDHNETNSVPQGDDTA